jgi:general secretion pathway protein F
MVALAPVAALVFTVADGNLRRTAVNRLLRIPFLRRRHEMFELCRVYRLLVMLTASGTSMVRALQVVRGAVSALYASRADRALALVERGTSVSVALREAGLATQVSVRLLAAGEQTGGMTQAMARIAEMHEQQLARDIDWALKVLEPLLMLGIGLAVGAAVLLLYLPIFELASAFN